MRTMLSVGVRAVLTPEQNERELIESRLKRELDDLSSSRLPQRMYEKGFEQGRLIGRIQVCQEELKLPVSSMEELCKFCDLDLARLERYLWAAAFQKVKSNQ